MSNNYLYIFLKIILKYLLGKYCFYISYFISYKIKYKEFLLFSKTSVNYTTDSAIVFSNHNIPYCYNIEAIIAKSISQNHLIRIYTLSNTFTFIGSILSSYLYSNVHLPLLIEKYFNYSKFKSEISLLHSYKTLDEFRDFQYDSIPVGIFSLSTLCSNSVELNLDINDNKIKNRLISLIVKSLNFIFASKCILEKYQPKFIISVEKGYVGTFELFYVCLQYNIPFIQYSGCHQPNTIMLKKYSKKNYRDHPFSVSKYSLEKTKYHDEYHGIVHSYLENGYRNGLWFKYKNLSSSCKSHFSKDKLVNLLKCDPKKRNVVIFSHVLNDANFFYGEDLFKGGFSEWLCKTVEVSQSIDDVNWILKLHPANEFKNKQVGYSGECGEILAIKKYLGYIPSNLKVISSSTDINPLDIFHFTDICITVRGTVGAELPCFGVPVLNAGTGRYSGLGFTMDPQSVDEYFQIIRSISSVPPLSDDEVKLAIKHAYLFFVERPFDYSSFLNDVYLNKTRDVIPTDFNFLQNHDLINLTNFIVNSNDEDFIMSKKYPLK